MSMLLKMELLLYFLFVCVSDGCVWFFSVEGLSLIG